MTYVTLNVAGQWFYLNYNIRQCLKRSQEEKQCSWNSVLLVGEQEEEALVAMWDWKTEALKLSIIWSWYQDPDSSAGHCSW